MRTQANIYFVSAGLSGAVPEIDIVNYGILGLNRIKNSERPRVSTLVFDFVEKTGKRAIEKPESPIAHIYFWRNQKKVCCWATPAVGISIACADPVAR